LENGSWPHYWTEKLSDAFLGWSFPFYVGCPNLNQYFEEDSFAVLDPHDINGCIHKIETLIESDCYEQSINALRRSRVKVLNEYHFYPTILRCLQAMPTSERSKVVLRPHQDIEFSTTQKLEMRFRNFRKKIVRGK
jgi:hypothetical protein